MTVNPSLLQALLDLLTEVETQARPVDAVTSAYFRAHRQLDDQDRGALLEQLYALLRHRARLGWWLERLGAAHSPRHRLLAWLVLGQGQSAPTIRRLLQNAKGPVLTEAEAALLGGLQGQPLAHPEMPESVRLECPSWALDPLQRRFGPRFAAEMAATLAAPPLDLRVNPIKTDRDRMVRALRGLGMQAQPMALAPHGIRLAERTALGRLPGLRTGEIEIQDEGSQLIAHLVGAKPGERVVDFCAGAGGKTLALAAQMQNKGHIVACDVNETRLKRCAERHRRAGLHNVETRLLASETDRWVKRHKAGFDRVLIDAPCSGTGTWRRNPDARWRDPDLGLENLVALQARILASAARLVRPGGRLVYATCSMLMEENEVQIEAFLAQQPGFRLVPMASLAPELAGASGSAYLALTPAQHGTDGFFAAVLQKAADMSKEPRPQGADLRPSG